MKTYMYTGMVALNTTIRYEGSTIDIRLTTGMTASLPSDNGHIKALVGKGLLKEVKG